MTKSLKAAEKMVLEETERFHSQLPALMEEYEGKWVVFLDGAVRGSFDSEDEAYREGLREFGAQGGFVIARVAAAEPPPPVTAGVLFGLPA